MAVFMSVISGDQNIRILHFKIIRSNLFFPFCWNIYVTKFRLFFVWRLCSISFSALNIFFVDHFIIFSRSFLLKQNGCSMAKLIGIRKQELGVVMGCFLKEWSPCGRPSNHAGKMASDLSTLADLLLVPFSSLWIWSKRISFPIFWTHIFLKKTGKINVEVMIIYRFENITNHLEFFVSFSES